MNATVTPQMQNNLHQVGTDINVASGFKGFLALKEYREIMERDGVILDFYIIPSNGGGYTPLDYLLENPESFKDTETVNVFGVNFTNLERH